MKRTEQLLEAIGDVGIDLVETAEDAVKLGKRWDGILAAAACVAVLLGLGTAAMSGLSVQPSPELPEVQTFVPMDQPEDDLGPMEVQEKPVEDAPEQAEPPADLPVDYTVFCGNYSDTETVEGPCYTVSILHVEAETDQIELQISYVGVNASPVYTTESIFASVAEDHTVEFAWEDSWGNRGTGILLLNPDDPSAVQLLMTVTEQAEYNRATLSTHDQYKTLNRRQAD